MEEWNRLNPKKPSVVSVGDESTVSTITHATDTPVSCASEIFKLPIIHRVLLPFLIAHLGGGIYNFRELDRTCVRRCLRV
jgi:hypothetical protein